jgi:Mg2+/Co2+ transporter CorC
MKNPLLDKEVLEGLLKISETTFNTILTLRQKKKKMNNNTELEQITKEIQQECHSTVEGIIDGSQKPVSVQDATNVFFYRKLAEMELRLRKLEKGNARTQSFIGRNTPLK